MSISRRSLLRGLLASPFVAKAEWLMPVRPLPLPYLRGDLIRWRPGVTAPANLPIMLCAQPVLHVGADYVVVRPGFGPSAPEYKVPATFIDLFHGLPGNRVNNPSARHRLVRNPDGFGLAYPEDIVSRAIV